jgi:uncharacterized protein (TIGR02996 family)
MSESEEAFLQAIAERPFDVGPRLVYADWLEERGDARAQKVRAGCRYRLPVTPAETRHLAAIAAARQGADAGQVAVEVDPARPGYPLASEPGAGTLADDLRHLSALEIARNFPRDDRGRLQLGCAVLLAPYRTSAALPRLRDLCLVAAGPARRSDPQTIRVQLDLLILDNQPHNWSQMRWWWDRRQLSLDEGARWGITGADLRAVTGPRRGRRLADLTARWQAGTLRPAERIALCTALQDEGRFEEALRVCAIDYPREVSRLLDAETFSLPGGGDYWGRQATAARAEKLRRALWEAAPWRFARALADVQARLDAWTAARPGRPSRTPQLRLFIFPGSPQARKPGLMLVPGPGGRPQLAIRFTASNAVVPESAWKRPVELDIARWCGSA